MPKFSDLYVALGFDDRRFKAGLKRSSKQMSFFQKQMKSMGTIIAGAFAARALINFGREAMRVNIEFEKTMSGVRAITGATDTEFKILTDSARELGKVTTRTASQVAQLQTEFARIGFTTQEILNATQATIHLSEATGEDLAQAAQIAGATLRGFGKDAVETKSIVDLMAKSFSSSALNLERWGESMKYVAPVARAANVSIEETAAMMSILADAGIHGSMAGTALRMMMLRLTKSGKPLSERLEELAEKGISLADANDEVGQRAQTVLLVLAKQSEKVKELTGEYGNLNDNARKMAEIATDNVAGALDRLKSAWQEIILRVQTSTGAIKGFIEGLTSLMVTERSHSQVIMAEQDSLNTLVGMITNANTSQKIRNDLIDELQLAYPKFLQNLDAEKVTNEQLAIRLDEVNKQYRVKIAQILLDEELADTREKLLNTYRREREQLELIEDAKKRDNAYTKQNISAFGDNIRLIKEQRVELEKNIETVTESISAWLELNDGTLSYFDSSTDEVDEFTEKIKQLKEEINRLNALVIKGDPLKRKQEDISFQGGRFQTDEDFPINISARNATDEIDTVIKHSQLLIAETELIQKAYADLFATVGEGLADIFTGDGGIEDFGNRVLGAFGKFLQQFGELLIAYGVADAALKFSFDPYSKIAAGVALVAIGAAIQNLSSGLGEGFADGGIVGGHSYHGDQVAIRANSGEMILNGKQQKNLFDMINMGGGGGNSLSFEPAVVRGSDIILAVDNTNKRRGIVR